MERQRSGLLLLLSINDRIAALALILGRIISISLFKKV